MAGGATNEVHWPGGVEGDDGVSAGVGILRAVVVAIGVVTLAYLVHAVAKTVCEHYIPR